MQTLPGFVYRCRPADTRWAVDYVSDGVRAVTGFGPGAFRPGGPMTFERVIDPADLARVTNEIRGALAARRTYQLTYAMIDAHGRRRRVWELGRGVWTESGNLEAVDGYVAELGGHADEAPKVLDLRQMVAGIEALLRRFFGGEVELELVASGDGGRAWVDASGAERVVLKLMASGSDVVPRRGRVTLAVTRDPGSEVGKRTGLGVASVDVVFAGGEGEDGEATGDVGPSPADRRQAILLVEDDDRLRRILRQLLEGEGYQVLPAAGADDALSLARSAPRIDLLVTDVVMPDLSGPELADRLGTLRPGLPVLYVSGYTGKAFGATTLLPPTVAFLPKPVVPGRLFEKIRQILDDATEAVG
jgi:CheY-like chemotaxis protein